MGTPVDLGLFDLNPRESVCLNKQLFDGFSQRQDGKRSAGGVGFLKGGINSQVAVHGGQDIMGDFGKVLGGGPF